LATPDPSRCDSLLVAGALARSFSRDSELSRALFTTLNEQKKKDAAMFSGKSSVLDYFRKPADPKELVRKWQADLRTEQRSLDRQIRDLNREEKNAQKQVRFFFLRFGVRCGCAGMVQRPVGGRGPRTPEWPGARAWQRRG
jgi:hypothetical protein